MTPKFEAVLRDIMAASSLEEVWADVVGHYAHRGFQAVAYVLFEKGEQDNVAAFIEHGFPPAVVNIFAELGYGKDAPLLRVALGLGKPQLASWVSENSAMTRDERKHREAILAAGLTEALALPVYGPAGRNAVVVLAAPADEALFDAANWPEFQIVAQAAHVRFIAIAAPGSKPRGLSLSKREIEILRWVAQGKSNSVIAQILGISSGTVDTYLRRIFEKLEVADRTSAAVKGVGLGLIAA
jgi:DNA-binding CsgD family transcriptional regulator